MADERISMPMSSAGITRYFEDYKSKIEIKPGHVILLIVIIIILEIVLFAFGRPYFGIS